MARPRTIEYKEGTISLQGYSKEDADRLESLLTEKPVSLVAEVPSLEFKAFQDLTHEALGTYYNQDGWHVVTVGFDFHSGHAKVKSTQSCGKERADCIERFKIEAVNKEFV